MQVVCRHLQAFAGWCALREVCPDAGVPLPLQLLTLLPLALRGHSVLFTRLGWRRRLHCSTHARGASRVLVSVAFLLERTELSVLCGDVGSVLPEMIRLLGTLASARAVDDLQLAA